MPLTIEVEQEDDGRWLAEVPDIPGALAYGRTRAEAIERVQALSLRVLADRLDHGEPVPQMSSTAQTMIQGTSEAHTSALVGSEREPIGLAIVPADTS